MSADPADLANLHDLALPPAVPLWPPPTVWWILAVGLLAIAAIGLARLWRRYRANAYRQVALRELAALPPTATAAAALSELLKRTALAAYPRAEVASLSGQAWLAFLDRTGGTTDFSQGPCRFLPEAAYGSTQAIDLRAVADCARRWIKGHRRC